MMLIFPLCLFRLDARNCTEWVPVNVTDLWGSCGVKYNTTRAWQCNEKSHERLLILFECTRLESPSNIIGKTSITCVSVLFDLNIWKNGSVERVK